MATEEESRPSHKRRVLLRPRIFDALERMAARDEAELAELANRAVREMLEREGLWPPKSDPPPSE